MRASRGRGTARFGNFGIRFAPIPKLLPKRRAISIERPRTADPQMIALIRVNKSREPLFEMPLDARLHPRVILGIARIP